MSLLELLNLSFFFVEKCPSCPLSFFPYLEFTVLGDESAMSDAEEERVKLNFCVVEDVTSSDEVVAVGRGGARW